MEKYITKMEDFKKRWNIPDSPYEEEFKKFSTRIQNTFQDIDDYLHPRDIEKFMKIIGVDKKYNLNRGKDITIITAITNSYTKEKELFYIFEVLFTLPLYEKGMWEYRGASTSVKDYFYKELTDIINLSNINLAITKIDDEIILYPKGEKELDRLLVNEVLSFLNNKSQEHFIEALKFYEQNNPHKSVESIRRSIEEFLRHKLQNTKGLDKNISDLGIKLKSDGIDNWIKNNITQTFSNIDKYFNENSKHNDGDIKEAENEYIIYQAGVLMRYIHKVIV